MLEGRRTLSDEVDSLVRNGTIGYDQMEARSSHIVLV